MANVTLHTVGELLTLHCVLCGEDCSLDNFEEHAAEHARAGECWSYASFAGAGTFDTELEGWAVQAEDGDEQLWPFWIRCDRVTAAAEPRSLAAVCF